MKFFSFLGRHKIIVAIIIAIIIIGGYFLYVSIIASTEGTVSYETDEVVISEIEKVVSGSGQIEDVNQVDITADASGKVTNIYVEDNQEVRSGDLLFQLDIGNLSYSINSAQYDLDAAQLTLQQMKKPADRSDIIKAENDVQAAQDAFVSLQLSLTQQEEATKELRDQAQDWLDDHDEGDTEYNKYYNQKRDADRMLSELAKTGPAQLDEARAAITLAEATLIDLKAGPSASDIELQEVKVRKAQNTLNELNSQWSDYQVRAPFDGVITDISVSVGDSASGSSASSQSSTSALSTTSSATSSGGGMAVLLTGIKKAKVVINEVDIPEIKIGQKAILTFDAVTDLEISGDVTEIDEIGTVNQGVVSHDVEISFSSQDDRIKSGMSVDTDIIVASETNILVIPSSSIKMDEDENSYVEMLDDSRFGEPTLRRVDIEVGITDDTLTEIIQGLEEGDEIVVKETKMKDDAEENQGLFAPPEGVGPGGSGFSP